MLNGHAKATPSSATSSRRAKTSTQLWFKAGLSKDDMVVSGRIIPRVKRIATCYRRPRHCRIAARRPSQRARPRGSRPAVAVRSPHSCPQRRRSKHRSRPFDLSRTPPTALMLRPATKTTWKICRKKLLNDTPSQSAALRAVVDPSLGRGSSQISRDRRHALCRGGTSDPVRCARRTRRCKRRRSCGSVRLLLTLVALGLALVRFRLALCLSNSPFQPATF